MVSPLLFSVQCQESHGMEKGTLETRRGKSYQMQIMYEIHINESHIMNPMYLSLTHRVSTDVLILRDLLQHEAINNATSPHTCLSSQ